jgi:hypothetical protein
VFLDRNRLPANEPDELSDSDNDDDDDSTYASDADDDFDFDSDDDDDDDDSEYHPHDEAADTDDGLEYDSDDTDGTTGVDAANAPAAAVPPAADATTGVDADEPEEPEDETDAGETTGVDADEPEDEPNDGETTGVDTEAQIGETTGVDADADADAHDTGFDDQGQLERDMEARYGPRTERYNMRQRKQRDYSHLFATEGTEEAPVATPQMSMKRGLKEFGDDGVAAVKSEMLQLHDRKVMAPKHATDLTPSQKREALAYLMFLKRKRCGKVKGRGCADGRKQRAYTAREDAASPTVATESVFLTAVIDALEGRDVAVIDVPGAFMQADMDELVHVRFTGKMVDLLLEIDRDMYEPCVSREGKEKVMYVELLKALYGTVRAARLFWEKLTGKLLEWGFTPNPYDPCVMNKMVGDKQLTVAWHVDDLKVSHVLSTVVDQFIEDMESEFGKETPLNKSRGKVHDYLGMTLDFSTPGEVTVTMIDYIKAVLHDAPKEMRGRAVTPAATHLLQINTANPVPLGKEKAALYVHIVMQLLYLSQRARPDIRTAVSFLCSRLLQPDEDDYKKLARVMKYLDSSVDMPLVLAADDSGQIRWWVDASYAVHDDMKSHTGGTMSMGKGSIYSTSIKQKLVTRSSTEAEIVAVHDVMPQLLWTTHFLTEQGISVNESILYQDNMSSILLEKNGRSSSTKRMRHMNIRYFFVKDQVDSKRVKIDHCPTSEMLADFFTKPLQGGPFRKLRDHIMNHAPSSVYHSNNSGHRSVLKINLPAPNSNDVSSDATSPPRSYKDVLMGSGPPKK